MSTKKTTSRKNITEIISETKAAPLQDDRAKKVRLASQEKAITDSASLSIEKVTQSLTKAGLDITKTLGSVRELFESEISSLQVIKDAIAAKQEELEQLYDKEVVASALSDLVLQYEASQASLFKTQADARKVWEQELVDHDSKLKERLAYIQKERARETEEYEYNKTISRRNEEEAWRAKQQKLQVEFAQFEDSRKKSWAEREDVLKKKEAEIAAASEKVQNFDSLVKAEVDKQVAIISGNLKSKYDTDARIKALEFDSDKRLLAHDNAILKSLLEAKEKEMNTLRSALEKKDSEVKDVAVAALNSQSGKQALLAVQETVQSQATKK